jgi:hypothetical protein
MTAPVPDDVSITHLVCGCTSTHKTGCVLGDVEQIAFTAAAEAQAHGHNGLIAALQAADVAGWLLDVGMDDAHLAGVLDALYERGLLGRKS